MESEGVLLFTRYRAAMPSFNIRYSELGILRFIFQIVAGHADINGRGLRK
jgi:hypothetical protein